MKKELVRTVLDGLNALIVDETNSADAGHYKRVMRLAVYAERIHQMDCKRVANVTDHAGRPLLGAGMGQYYAPGMMIGDEVGREIANVENEVQNDLDGNNDGLGPDPFPLRGGVGVGMGVGVGGDYVDVMREMMVNLGNLTNKPPPPRNAGQLAYDLDGLISTRDRLEALAVNDEARKALPAIHANIEVVTQQLQDAAKPPAPKEKRRVQLAPHHLAAPDLVDPVVLRRHPPHLDVPQDVHAAVGEVDGRGGASADRADVQGPLEGVDRP